MLRHLSQIRGYAIGATDEALGKVTDVLFDDETWLVRWLVVDTGHILPGRKVLLPPSILGHIDHIGRQFDVRLTAAEVKASPDIDTDAPVSRRMERGIYDYYGWSPYWNGGFYTGGFGYGGGIAAPPVALAVMRGDYEKTRGETEVGDRHLRSASEVTGYHLLATDGEIGHVADLLVEDGDWSVRYLVADTANWWPGEKVLISPRSVASISWTDRIVALEVDRQKVKDGPAYDPAATVDRAYEKRLHDHYGRRAGA